MNVQLVKSKFKTAGIHLLVTALIAGAVMAFVTHFWYPYGTLKLLKGWDLFLLLLACDVALGPVLSFVVFNPKKPRKEKWLDYFVIAVVQIAGLTYGLHAVSQNRLQFLVFAADRFEVVSAGELSASDLHQASKPAWQAPGYFRHFVVSVQVPAPTSKDYIDLVMSGLDGRDLQYFTDRYQELGAAGGQLLSRIQPVSALSGNAQGQIMHAIPRSSRYLDIGWLPLSHDRNFWTMVVERSTGRPIWAVNIDPYDNLTNKGID